VSICESSFRLASLFDGGASSLKLWLGVVPICVFSADWAREVYPSKIRLLAFDWESTGIFAIGTPKGFSTSFGGYFATEKGPFAE